MQTDAFLGCSSLDTVYYAGSVDSWGQINFESASSNPIYSNYAKLYINNELLTEAVLSDSVSKISYAFAHCKTLENVVLPESLTYLGKNAFVGCSALTSVTFPYSNKNWKIEDVSTVSGATGYSAYNDGGKILYLKKSGTKYEVVDLSSPSAVAKILTSQIKFGSASWTATNLYAYAWTCE